MSDVNFKRCSWADASDKEEESKLLKHWSKVGDGEYKANKNDRTIGFSITGDGITLTELCDGWFEASYSKEEFIELLEEAIKLVKG